jgi:hypothetical protein
MQPENFLHAKESDAGNVSKSVFFAQRFAKLSESRVVDATIFEELERTLTEKNFNLAPHSEVAKIFNDNSLLCRSENFSRTIDLLTDHHTLVIENDDSHANMCTMMSGQGFRIAMMEGFSGKDVKNNVKTVITFSGDHISDRHHVPSNDSLWETKPDTATVSVVGKGQIEYSDITMVSFRFPIHIFPSALLTEEEKDALEEKKTRFIVRHYVPNKKMTVH